MLRKKLSVWRMISISGTPEFFECRFEGILPNKSNSRRIFRAGGGRHFIPKAPEAIAFVDWFCREVASRKLPFVMGERLGISVYITPTDMRRDLDIELLCDALQCAGIVANDRAFWRKRAQRLEPNKHDPHVSAWVWPIERVDSTIECES